MEKSAKFFLGAVSENGFISYFKQLQEDDSMQLLILKGGPGCGKSTLMRKIGEYARSLSHNVEYVPCASDPESLDAIVDKTASFAMLDGTAPHTEEPLCPGVRHHTLQLGELWNRDILKSKAKEIDFHANATGELHKSAAAYIKAAGALLRENNRCGAAGVLPGVEDAALEIMKEFPDGKAFSAEKKLLSAVTFPKICCFSETPGHYADSVYVLEDEWGSAGDVFFDAVIRLAKIKKLKTVICPCSVLPDKTDHIIFPEIGLAFLKENRFLPFEGGRKIGAELLYSKDFDASFSEKRLHDVKKLLDCASLSIKNAKKAHDRLEKYYISAMDFSKTEDVLRKIKADFYG